MARNEDQDIDLSDSYKGEVAEVLANFGKAMSEPIDQEQPPIAKQEKSGRDR